MESRSEGGSKAGKGMRSRMKTLTVDVDVGTATGRYGR